MSMSFSTVLGQCVINYCINNDCGFQLFDFDHICIQKLSYFQFVTLCCFVAYVCYVSTCSAAWQYVYQNKICM